MVLITVLIKRYGPQRLCAISGTASPALLVHTGTDRAPALLDPALLVHRRLLWFGHAAGRPEGELIKDLLLPTLPRMWHRRAGGQLKTLANTIKADLEPISGPRLFGHARRTG